MRPAHRRRPFFVLLSPSLRTMISLPLNNTNAVINLADVELPDSRGGIREFNELYRELPLSSYAALACQHRC